MGSPQKSEVRIRAEEMFKTLGAAEVAKILFSESGWTDKGHFSRRVRQWKSKSQIPTKSKINTSNEASKKAWEEDGNKATFSYNGREQINNLEDAIRFSKVDLDVWEVERHVFNTWETTLGAGNGNFNQATNIQIKIWFKKIEVIEEEISLNTILTGILDEVKLYAPKYPKITYLKSKENHLLVVDPADIHIGKLSKAFETGEDYNHSIARERVMDGVSGLLQKSSSFNKDKIMLVIGNDILHVDTPKNHTTSGTPQDTCGMWYDNFLLAKKLYIDIIEMLLPIAPIHVQYDPSNHDYTNGFFLADTIKSWFNNCGNISFNTSIAHRKYMRYHSNLIGTTHGDGAKITDLAQLMAHEASGFWNECIHRYYYIHHIHHKYSKDFMSVTVESLRTPSSTDSWHHRNGYQHAPKAVEGFVHHPKHGQIARITHLF